MVEKNKKIGCVIAYSPGHNNYGTSLQGYATIRKIQDLGYDCKVINYKKELTFTQKVAYIKNALKAGYSNVLILRLKKKLNLYIYPTYAKGIAERTKAVNIYKEKKITPHFEVYNGYNNLHKGSLNYKAVVVGSDQVWTPLSLPNKFFNLLFVDDKVAKIAYASSFGVSEIPEFQKKATGEYLNRFQSIGVREVKGKEIVESLSKKKAQVVADPTLLLTQEEWKEEIKDSIVKENDPFIFVYLLGPNPNARKAVNELKKKTGYKIITIRHMDEYVPKDENFGDEAPYYVNPTDFVKYISEAAYVCTDSFHCTVFSIIFNKQFMTFYRFAVESKTSRNSRIDSLFEVLGIKRERIYAGEICNSITKSIDYPSINKELKILRESSIQFLAEALKEASI